jgi:hypothetical protein
MNRVRGFVTFSFICEEMIDLGGCTIIGNDCEAFIVHVKNEILAL